jgi:hypothetical protein
VQREYPALVLAVFFEADGEDARVPSDLSTGSAVDELGRIEPRIARIPRIRK